MFSAWTSVFLMLTASSAYAGFCARWEAGKAIGSLSPKEVREASGMVASQKFPNRVYWINDSGDKGYFYYSDPNGKNMRKVKIAGYKPRDTEAITVADCSDGPCLAIGDIGDNNRKRKHVKIIFIPELKEYATDAKISRTLTLEYPTEAYDAESMAFLPNGDLWIVTKEIYLTRLDVGPAAVFALSKSQWWGTGDRELKLKKVGELPLPKWLDEDLFFAQAATDIAINSQREVLGVLTYGKAVEIPLKKLADLANSANWKKDIDYSIVQIEALAQQESLTYLPHPDRILWSTEYRTPDAPIFSMTCTRPAP